MYKKIIAIGLLLALSSGCANNYRLVKTSQMQAINQCAIASDHNHQILLEQQQIVAVGLEELLVQLEDSRRMLESQQAIVCPELEVQESHAPATTERAVSAIEIAAGTQVVGT